ncbi:C40 family peptidase [Viridibacillus sp. YIM B01967]|uniref:C40 family peptidase n=2 Tax=Viridibacillus soli TaxID=2798301 RepID=A0ABS1HC70_9BACL|nr:C40 family peptidase [Viridibacillus soli]
MYTVQPLQAEAATSKEMTQKKIKIDKKIKKLNKEIKDLKEKLQEKTKEYKVTQKSLKKVNESITETEKRIASRSEIIDDRLKAYQNHDSAVSPYIEAVLGSDSLTDLVSRAVSVKTIIDADQTLLSEQEDDKQKLADQKAELEETKAKLQKQFQQMQEEENALETKKAENKVKSLQLKKQIASKKEEERIAKELKEKEKEAQKLLELQNTQFISNEGNAGNGSNGGSPSDGDQSAPNVSGSQIAIEAIAEASNYLGTSYVWGGSNPSTGFDCSGLTQWAFKKAGYSLPRTAAQQYLATKKIDRSSAKAGDLVFFSYGSGVAHVGIYLGDNKMLDSQNNGVVVETLDWWNQYLVGFGRVSGVN